MQYRDLRDFIRELEKRGELKRIQTPVSPVLEMTEICDRTLRKGGPALLFEQPTGFAVPVLGNLFGTPKRVALGMGAEDVGELREIGKLLAFLKEPEPPKGLKDAWSKLPIFKKVISMDATDAPDDELTANGKERLSNVDDDGVTFKSHLDGSKHRFTPEVSMQIQHQLGADIIFAFDELTTLMNTRAYQESSLERTRLWAIRCLAEHNRLSVQRSHRPQQSLWGVIQGAQYEDLRRKASRDLVALGDADRAAGGKGFGGYGIGGALEKDNLGTIVGWVNSELPQDAPKHLLGISEPDDIFTAIENGVDTFDCVSPTRVARNGAIYSRDGRYNVTNAKYRKDFGPLDPDTENYTSQYSRAYLHHLFKAKEGLAATLATLHNVSFVVNLVDGARRAIESGDYIAYRDDFLGRYYANS